MSQNVEKYPILQCWSTFKKFLDPYPDMDDGLQISWRIRGSTVNSANEVSDRAPAEKLVGVRFNYVAFSENDFGDDRKKTIDLIWRKCDKKGEMQ